MSAEPPSAPQDDLVREIDAWLGNEMDAGTRIILQRASARIADMPYYSQWVAYGASGLSERIAELERALAQAEQDAARYQWLRHTIGRGGGGDGKWEVRSWSVISDGWLWCDSRMLDERIDTALAARAPEAGRDHD